MHGLYHKLISYFRDLEVLATLVNWIYVIGITKYQCTHRIRRKQPLCVILGRLNLLF